MNRKLTVLSLLLLALLGVSVYLWLFGKPTTPKENPLKNVDIDKMTRLVITNSYGTTRLEKKDGVWMIIEPISDLADPSIPSDIMTALKSFTLGSIISENSARYGEFQVDAAQGAHVDVYLEGQEKPALSGFVGKASTGYENSYFRFDVSSGPVYLANSLPQYQFRREPGGFRWMKVLTFPGEPTKITLEAGKKKWEVTQKSSETWVVPSGAVVAEEKIFELLKTIDDWSADGFSSTLDTPSAMGVDMGTPYLELTVYVGSTTYTATAGKVAPETFPGSLKNRFVRASNRPLVFQIQENMLKHIIDLFSKLPK